MADCRLFNNKYVQQTNRPRTVSFPQQDQANEHIELRDPNFSA
jgi:hypothetical protein